MKFGVATGLIRLDPRTKLLLLTLGSISVFVMPDPRLEYVLVGATAVLGVMLGTGRFMLRSIIWYGVVIGASFLGITYASGEIQIVIVASVLFLRKLFPTVMLGYLLISTTKVNELVSALSKMRVPRSIVIPFAVTLRFFPVVIENWGYIKDAMRLRGLSPSLAGLIRYPARTLECVYVPMLMSASNISDDLSRASVTRGIENPRDRSCLVDLSFGAWDALWTLAFLAVAVAGIVM